MNDLGTHVLLDLHSVEEELLIDESFIENTLKESAKIAKSEILNVYTHKFDGAGGVTTVIALAESHLSIHTWPELNKATIDIYMCGKGRPEIASEYILEKFNPKSYKISSFKRGED